MIQLLIEKFIKEHKNWEELLSRAPYNLTIRHDDGLVLFKYSQYESDMSLRICQEARGIIFDEETLTPVCVPYFKFFNYGEENAADIDWATAQVQEKVDGSLMKMFFWNGQWRLATNGTIDAFKAVVGDNDTNFGCLFVDALGGLLSYYAMCEVLKVNYCYMFELVHPLSQVVIEYAAPAVYLHGQRNMDTLEEKTPNELPFCLKPKNYGINDLFETLSLVSRLNDGAHEGVVVCDAHYNRIKMKTEEYLAQAKLANVGPLTAKNFARMFLNNNLDDYLAFASEMNKERINQFMEKVKNINVELNSVIEFLNKTEFNSRKDIVFSIKENFNNKLPYFDFAMSFIDKKVHTPMEYITHMHISQLSKIL